MRPDAVCPKCSYKWQPWRFWPHQKEGNLCYCCSLWPKWVRRKDDPGVVRCQGRHYTILGDLEYNYHVDRDFVYLISFYDGRVVASRNVECQGAIGTIWLPELPNNAYSVRKVPVFETLGFGNFVHDEDFDDVQRMAGGDRRVVGPDHAGDVSNSVGGVRDLGIRQVSEVPVGPLKQQSLFS